MKINQSLAQEIADKVMMVIPYNVNIMNEVGLIIGSGDNERIGTYHHGAIKAIEQGSMVSIHSTEGFSKPGVNIPIHFKNRLIGVIGISGDPGIVEPFAELVRVTAELLINQELLFKERRVKEQMKEEFLYQWVFRIDEYDEAFINNGDALGIHVNIPRKAVMVNGSLLKEPYLQDQEYSFKFNQNSHLFIVPSNSDILKRLEVCVSPNDTTIGVGNSYIHVNKSIHEAKRAIEIAEKMKLPLNLCQYQELKFIDYLSNKDISFGEISDFFKQMDENPKGQELVETLICYIKNNGDINSVSKELHIHRNSLAYRLQRIEVLTDKNPKKFMDLFQLFTGYILYQMQ